LPPESQYLISRNREDIHAIISSLDRERLAAYFRTTRTDVEALTLYALNAHFSIHLLEVIGGFEVALRNVVSRSITDHFSRHGGNGLGLGDVQRNWHRDPAFTSLLEDRHRQVIERTRRWPRNEGADLVIAELSLHFWVALHEKRYEHRLWTPFPRKVWPAART